MEFRTLAEDLLRTMAYQKMPMEKPNQMSVGERGILNYLRYVRDGALAGDLSRDLGITTGRTASALKNLEKKGLIARDAAEDDRRCVVVHITPSGVEAAESLRKEVLEHTELMLRTLGEDDARAYVRIVKRIVEFQIEQARTEGK